MLHILVLGLLVFALADSAAAERWRHDREGFTLGLGLGAGSATFDPSGDVDSADNEGGGALGLRLGWAVNQNWVLLLDGNGWSKSDGGATTTVSVGGIGVSWFPQGEGFYLRAMVGSSRIELELDFGSFRVTPSADGFGGSLAVGHEWRLTRTFALGPELTFSRASFDGEGDAADLDVSWISATAALNWYF
jgi:hypothetical protein